MDNTNWLQANEVGYISVDDHRVWQTRFTARKGTQVCGKGPAGPRPRWSEIKDQQIRVGPLTIQHSARQLRLRVGTVRGSELAKTKFFGIGNLTMSTPSPCIHGRCHQQCDETSCEPYTCACDLGYKGQNCTDPHTHAWAIIPYMSGMGRQHFEHTATAKPGVRVCAPFAETHAVRCCSDQHVDGFERGVMYNFKGCNTWSEGKFVNGVGGSCPPHLADSGCVTARDNSGYCIHAASFNQTLNFCRGQGVRMCSAREVSAGCVASVGCYDEDDKLLVWTNDYCHT